MNITDGPQVVSYANTGRALATSARAAKALVKSGHLVAVRLPGRKRASGVTRSSLEKLIAQSALVQK